MYKFKTYDSRKIYKCSNCSHAGFLPEHIGHADHLGSFGGRLGQTIACFAIAKLRRPASDFGSFFKNLL